MKVNAMTFNIRYDNKDDGKNRFDGRKAIIKKFFGENKPDVIGFQEVEDNQRRWLIDNLEDYTVLGMGRNADYSGESVSIAYRKDKFDIVSFEQYWLSDTPYVPGSKYKIDQSPCPRISVQATLVDHSGNLFTFANTHLDHWGVHARVCGASLLISKLLQSRHPFILTGDFNEFPDGKAIKEILGNKGVHDLTRTISKHTATYHGYGAVKKDCKIDYIFSSGKAVKETLKMHTECEGGIYLSDHYPISVDVEL